MKNTLMINYNLQIENLKNLNEFDYTFYIDYIKFQFINIKRPNKDIEEIYQLLSSTHLPYDIIIKNIYGSIFTEYDNKTYILIKIIHPENMEIDIKDIIDNFKALNKNYNTIDRSEWNKLWPQKIDYLEYQISELGKNYPIIRGSFSYYIGLAENAVQYLNSIKIDNGMKVLAHRRLKFPIITRDFYNPLELVIDYRVRDLAEYIKTKFFDESVIEEIEYLTNKNLLTPTEYNLLFARLLYPSYYFDEIQEILENGKDEITLLKYIEKVDSYEKFILKVYEIFSQKTHLLNIDWLIKKS